MAKTLLAFVALVITQHAYSAPISFRWCVLTAEKTKCNDFIKYANETAQSKSLEVAIACVDGNSTKDCMTKITSNQADLVTLSGGDVYKAGETHNLVPIVSEQYGNYGVKYYAVAVVKKANQGLNINALKGKKSCHTGARRTAGWRVPIGYLRRKGILPSVECGKDSIYDFLSAAKFFSQSCVPGVPSHNTSGNIPGNLCALCAGTGADKCSTDASKNKYVSYHGAFMCMAENKGDVAFVKHTTTQEVVDKGNHGKVADYAYLCKDGSTRDIGQHETCNLGFNPGHAVVTRKGNADITNIIKILTAMSDMYGTKQTNPQKFQLFNSTQYNGTSLLFKDSSTALVAIVPGKQTYQGYLEDYAKDTEAMTSCDKATTTTTTTPKPTSGFCATSPYAMLVLFIALFTLL